MCAACAKVYCYSKKNGFLCLKFRCADTNLNECIRVGQGFSYLYVKNDFDCGVEKSELG